MQENSEANDALFTNLQKATSDSVECSEDFMLQLTHSQLRELVVNNEIDANTSDLSFREKIR
jgi:hypothetical protein